MPSEEKRPAPEPTKPVFFGKAAERDVPVPITVLQGVVVLSKPDFERLMLNFWATEDAKMDKDRLEDALRRIQGRVANWGIPWPQAAHSAVRQEIYFIAQEALDANNDMEEH